MKKTKLLSLLLCLSLVCTLFVSGTTAYAEGESNPGDGMKINKTAEVIDDKGTTRITLEAFATGSKVITTETKDVPTDIILVIDQSGSMGDKMGTVSYSQYTKSSETKNNFYYGKRHNGGEGNLWHKLDDDSYVSVSVTKTTTYNPLRTDLPNYNRYSECYWDYANNLYEKVGNEYKKVKLDSEYMYFVGNRYTYTFADGTTVVSDGDSTVPNLGSHAPLYTPAADNNSTVYTYTYTDNTGAVQTIGTSTGANATGPATFYKSTINPKQGEVRLTAIKNAATTFANAVAKKAGGKDGNINTTADNVNHRIAVVGFASQSGYGNNTELLSIKGSNSGSVGVAYNSITDQNLKDVLQSMDTQAGQKMVTDAINALAANGATRTDLGMNMANRILEKNPLVNNETRNRVVVVFTDGSPTNNNGFEKTVAQNAITTANAIKDGNTTVYTIGIFGGADAASAGAEPSEDLSDGASYMSAACNWFMQNVSSNNGTPRTPSFYLSAGDSASLNNIFQQISSNIQTGGSGTTLGSETVVKDIISPYFTLPAGATATAIRLATYACEGKDGDTYTWSSTSSGADGARATVNGDTVSVTGFNFSENWCGTETDTHGNTTVRGKKLVISFDVKPKDGFLGGNGVPTNTSAGIYENANATTPVKEFPIPTVNVPIQPVTVTAQDKNVYLLGTVTENDCKNGATATCNGVDLLKESEYTGTNAWKADYVKITTNVTKPDAALTADGTYTISVTVKPNPQEPGIVPPTGTPATEKNGTVTKKINVFKPELTFKDTEAYYGDTAPKPENLKSNLTNTVWKHGETVADPATMLGTKPELTITYAPDGNKILNGKINTTEDIGVAVTVKIGDTDVTKPHTTFQHTNCANQTCTPPEGYQFLIHVKTCTLTVKKELAAGTTADAGQRFLFTITSPNGFNQTVVVEAGQSVKITGLKVGTYTVTEDTAWSWRYKTTDGTQTATLSAANPEGSVTVTNTLENHQWVSTDVYCKNEFKNDGIQTIINGNGKTVNGNPVNN
mgnify:CR=1 FL=1